MDIRMRKNLKKRRGQTIAEYIIIVAIVAVAAIAVLGIFSDSVRGMIGNIAKVFGSSEEDTKKSTEYFSEAGKGEIDFTNN